MKKAYVFPLLPREKLPNPNPYIENVIESFSAHFEIVNKGKPAYNGVFDLLKFFFSIDVLFLNWPEDLPDKKGGFLQTIAFLILFMLFKIKGVKLIWTMHNKQSHHKSNQSLKKLLFKFLIRQSTAIITHSREGLRYFESITGRKPEKVKYLPHPIEYQQLNLDKNITYDFLIWGAIKPYKAIDRFLEYLYDHELEKKYKIMIAGSVSPESYKEKIGHLCNNYITLDANFLSEPMLKTYMAQSNCVLFTYSSDSVLSSGALMDTLAMGCRIIGPNTGAFRDLAEEDLIDTYTDYQEILQIYEKKAAPSHIRKEKINEFIRENTWSVFAAYIYDWIYAENKLN